MRRSTYRPHCRYHVNVEMREEPCEVPYFNVIGDRREIQRTMFRCPIVGCACVKNGNVRAVKVEAK